MSVILFKYSSNTALNVSIQYFDNDNNIIQRFDAPKLEWKKRKSI